MDDFTGEFNLKVLPAEAARTSLEGFHCEPKLRIQPVARSLKIAFGHHDTGRLGSLRVQLPAAAQ